MTLKASIKSMRLRTLPLSLAGVILGVTLAADKTDVSPWTAALIFLTTVCLQILSNLSNELGDTLSGTDSADRQGPKYALGSGDMTIGDIKKLILMFIGLCVIFGLAMIQVSFGSLFKTESICLEALGAAAIVGAMKYTLGKNPYGYRGLGDVFVFIFFGLVSVLGGYYVGSGVAATDYATAGLRHRMLQCRCAECQQHKRHEDGCGEPRDRGHQTRNEGGENIPDHPGHIGLGLDTGVLRGL